MAAFSLLTGLIRLLPIDTASDLGAWLLRRLGPRTGVHKTVRRNLRLAFPDKTPAERARIAADQWENLGRYFAEFMMLDRLTLASGRIEVVGWERLGAIAEGGQGLVFVSGHLSNFEVMAAAILGAGVPCVITGRAANNPHFDAAVIRNRQSYGLTIFAPKGGDGTREMLRSLREGRSVAIMNDQKNNRGAATTFFGHQAHAASGPAKLALRAGGRVQPMSVRRLKGARFQVTAHEPILFDQTGDRDADVAAAVDKITAFIEARIRESPGEWFWSHKRWPDEVYAALARGEIGAPED